MNFYSVEPEVAGELGERTEADFSTSPPAVYRLHYVFSGWLGDDLLETYPCYIITERLSVSFEKEKLSGYCLDEVEVSESSQFDGLQPGKTLPVFCWLKPIGVAGVDDFGIDEDNRMVISERVLSILKSFSVEHCRFELRQVQSS